MESTLTFASQLARQAGQSLVEAYHSHGFQTSIKSDRSAVTEADIATDRLIAEAIQTRYPGARLMSEELHPDYPETPVQEATQSVWIVDPIDGTTNFSLGVPIWGIVLAHLQNGWPETAVLYFPMLDELYSAQRGQGAFLNGERISVQQPSSKRPFTFFSCCSRTFRRYQVTVPYKARIFGCAAYSLCSVARGISILAFEATPKIWDIAAAWLLLNEASCIIETLDSSQPFPLQTGINYTLQSYPVLAAATMELVNQARQQIVPR